MDYSIIFGRSWALGRLKQLFVSSFTGGICFVALFHSLQRIAAASSNTRMIPFLSDVKLQFLLLFWFAIISLVSLLHLQGDGIHFSGKATRWYWIVGRVALYLAVIIGFSAMFWKLWFATEPGTISVNKFRSSIWWKVFIQYGLTVLMAVLPWGVSTILHTGFDSAKAVYGTLIFVYSLEISIVYSSSSGPLQENVEVVTVLTVILVTVTARVFQDQKPGSSAAKQSVDGGITRNLFNNWNFKSQAYGFVFGVIVSTWFVLSRFPVSGDDPFFIVSGYIIVILPILAILTIRLYRV